MPVRYGVGVSVWETVLIFAVLPVAGLALLALLTFAPGSSRTPRYRVGRPWDHEPVWYIARPDVSAPAGSAEGRAAIAAAATGRSLPFSEPERSSSGRELTSRVPVGPAETAAAQGAPVGTARGGASGEW